MSRIIDLEVIWTHETEKAVLVASDEEAEPVWLPKSQVEIDKGEHIRGSLIEITLPQSLAEEKGLV